MSEVVSRCLPHRQLWVSNLSKVATQWREVDSNPRPFGCKAQNLPLHHGVPLLLYYIILYYIILYYIILYYIILYYIILYYIILYYIILYYIILYYIILYC